jgi:chaperonin GroES
MAQTAKLPLKPVGGNILVKPDGVEETSPSGLVIAASAREEKPRKGKVLALGTGKLDKDGNPVAWNLKVGDMVFFKQYSPDEVEFDGEKYLIMAESDVLAVFN